MRCTKLYRSSAKKIWIFLFLINGPKTKCASWLKPSCQTVDRTIGCQDWLSLWEFSPLSVAARRGWYMSGFTILSGRYLSMLSSLWMWKYWPVFALSFSPSLLLKVQNIATQERILYKMNDIKYTGGINTSTYSSCIEKGFTYIIKNVVIPSKAKQRQSRMLK